MILEKAGRGDLGTGRRQTIRGVSFRLQARAPTACRLFWLSWFISHVPSAYPEVVYKYICRFI